MWAGPTRTVSGIFTSKAARALSSEPDDGRTSIFPTPLDHWNLMRTMMWFRSDLRIDDNPALRAAMVAGSEGVVGLFLICPKQWGEHDWGPVKIDFVLRSVLELQRALDGLNIPLILQEADDFSACPALIRRSAATLGCEVVFANHEYEVNEQRRDRDVESRLAEAGCAMQWFHDQTIVPPGALTTQRGGTYSVFTPFWRSWVRRLEEGEMPLAQDAPEAIGKPLQISKELSVADGVTPDSDLESVAALWPAGERTARDRLEKFASTRIHTYETDRDKPSIEGTSGLSPYLAVGSLSIRRCLEAAVVANEGRLRDGSEGIDTWIKELAWREFYRSVLVGFPRVCMGRAFRRHTERLAWRSDEGDFESWCEGRTGIPFVDAGMRQLRQTGWMHNRLRMVTAMFLTKNLLIDWRLGEAFFNQRLVDADFASNNGGWQWSASTGTDSVPYFRIFNPWTQAKRYDPDGIFIRKWIPELSGISARVLHDPGKLTSRAQELDYPRPIVNLTDSRARALAAFDAIKSEGT